MLKQKKIKTKTQKRKHPLYLKKIAFVSFLPQIKSYPNQFCYKLPSDIFIYDNIPLNSNNEVTGILPIHNNFKRITSVVSDHNLNLVTAKLVTFDQEQASLLFLYEKLKSYGNIDAFRLAETLKKYYEFFENMDKLHADESFNETDLKNDEDYKDYCIKNSELLEVYSNVPLITWKLKTNYKSNMLEITEIGFNKLLYSLLSESKSDFIEGLMKNGFPDCIHTQENYFKFIEMMITQAFFQNNAQGHDLWCYIICKGYPKIPAKLKFKSNSFKKGNYYEHFLIDYFEINKKDSNNLEKYKQTRLNLKERMKNYKKKQRFFIDQNRPFSKDSLEFLTNFYPNIEISKKNNEDELRCKIKEIKELG